MRRPLQNRVTALGEIVADPARGLFMGNRGILHDADGTLGRARWRHKAWVTCRLQWKDWRRDVLQPGAYTELFFLDEAVALGAGHRPCALCRRGDYTAFKDAVGCTGPVSALDRRLHNDRAIPRKFAQRHSRAKLSDLPDGAIILLDRPMLIRGDALLPVAVEGYGPPVRRPDDEDVTLVTPRTSVAAMKNGYKPLLHPSAR